MIVIVNNKEVDTFQYTSANHDGVLSLAGIPSSSCRYWITYWTKDKKKHWLINGDRVAFEDGMNFFVRPAGESIND